MEIYNKSIEFASAKAKDLIYKKNKTDEVVKHTSIAPKRKKNKANEKDKKEQRANKETEIKIT